MPDNYWTLQPEQIEHLIWSHWPVERVAYVCLAVLWLALWAQVSLMHAKGKFHSKYMCGRAYGPRLLWMWPNSRISVMGGEQAASVLATVKRDGIEGKGGQWSAAEEEAFKAPIRQQYEDQGHPYYATARLWDDGILRLEDTRPALALALETALQVPIPEMQMGVIRM